MAEGQTHVERNAVLSALEAGLVVAPHSAELRCRRAGLLAALGRSDEARADYLAVLAGAPTHFGALNDLGTLLHATGYRTAARTAYGEAIAHHPAEPMARVNLANLLLEDGDVAAATAHYQAALAAAPDHPEAHQGLARIHDERGDDRAAEHHRRLGFRDRALRELPYYGAGPGVPLVILVAAVGGNVPTRPLIDDRIYRCTVVVADFFAGAALPAHRALFNAVGDADLCRAALDAAASLTARTTAPVINRPEFVLKTGRVENARRLADIPGVRAPRTAMVARHALATAAGPSVLAAQGFRFPLLLRRPGFHTGRHFLRIDVPAQLGAAVAALPGEKLDATRISRRARRRWDGTQISGDGGRRRALSAAPRDRRRLEGALLHRGDGRPCRLPRRRGGVPRRHGGNHRPARHARARGRARCARARLWRHRFWARRGRQFAAVRGQRDDGGEPA